MTANISARKCCTGHKLALISVLWRRDLHLSEMSRTQSLPIGIRTLGGRFADTFSWDGRDVGRKIAFTDSAEMHFQLPTVNSPSTSLPPLAYISLACLPPTAARRARAVATIPHSNISNQTKMATRVPTSVFCCSPANCRSPAAPPAFPYRLLVTSQLCPNHERGS